jgi:spore coat polysaccharide biosynthesis protein SpsF
MIYKTEQEEFWAGEFGNDYILRNNSKELVASNLNFFNKALKQAGRPQSLIEFGANIGMNLQAIQFTLSRYQITRDRDKQECCGDPKKEHWRDQCF